MQPGRSGFVQPKILSVSTAQSSTEAGADGGAATTASGDGGAACSVAGPEAHPASTSKQTGIERRNSGLVETFDTADLRSFIPCSLIHRTTRYAKGGAPPAKRSRPHSDDGIREAEEYLRDNLQRDVSISDLAGLIGASPRTFIRRFKAATGNMPHTYLQQLRVSAAKEMMERGEASISEVSSRIGYQDVAFFRLLLKRHTGMTPAEYRTAFAAMIIARGELAAGKATKAPALTA